MDRPLRGRFSQAHRAQRADFACDAPTGIARGAHDPPFAFRKFFSRNAIIGNVSYHLLEITGLFHWLLQGPTARWHTSLGQRPRSHGNATPGLKARSITVGEKMLRAFSADAFSASFPGALPQAGMLPRLWRSRVCVFLRDGITWEQGRSSPATYPSIASLTASSSSQRA